MTESTPFLGTFLSIDWNFWKIVGWMGNCIFFSRFLVQWWATEKKRQVVIPNAFWYLSLAGSLILLAYSVHKRDSVFIFAYLFTWIPYIRNLMISHRTRASLLSCNHCQTQSEKTAKFCQECGAAVGTAPLPD
jgi:lipid-A-disaccharide synthase-like uncharacterized protein